MRANRRLLCALFAFCVVVAGCGGKPFSASAGSGQPARLTAVIDKTTNAKTARVALALSGSSGGRTVTENGDGVIDFTSHALQLSVNATVSGMQVTLELRELDGKIYTRTTSALGSGSWRSVDASAGAASENTFDPSQFMSFLRGVSGDVRKIGTEQVRDADTTHYAAMIDPARLSALGSSAQDVATASVAKRVFGSMKSVPVDVWIDGKNRLRKLELSMSFSGESSVAGTDAKATIEFYDFGVPVHVDAPAGALDAGDATKDRATQSDLRNALTAEKVVYTDNQEYDSSPEHMKTIENSLNWGGKLKVVVGNAVLTNDIVCAEEQSPSGKTFSIADVADGPHAGTYYGTQPCPSPLTGASAAALGSSWVDARSSNQDNTSDEEDTSPETTAPSGSQRAVQSDLRNALTAEKTTYTDNQAYDASAANMKEIESSLDWGGALHVTVGDAVNTGDKGVVCLWESTATGDVFAIADVAVGPKAGTYFGHAPCGERPSPAIANFFGASWDSTS